MRIRRSASRLLGSAYSACAAPSAGAAPPFDPLLPPPPVHPAPCSAPESSGGTGFSCPSASSAEPCQLSRSPWDLIADLSLSDQKEEDDLMDKYLINVTTRASWLFSATMPATSSTKKKKLLPTAAAYEESSKQLKREVVKKAAAMNKEKEGENKKKAKVKKEEGRDDARVWMCKKNDGRRWHCNRPVSKPDTLCDYHSVQKHSYLNPDFEFHTMAELEEAAPAASNKQSSTSNKPLKRKKKKNKPGNGCTATEGFYYYAGFGPFRTKRRCGGMNKPLPAAKQEEEEEIHEDASHTTDEAAELTNQLAGAQDDVSSCDKDNAAGIAGIDEESSDDEYDGIAIHGCDMDGTVDPQACIGKLGKRKAPWKRWRKPVKARSLKSLM